MDSITNKTPSSPAVSNEPVKTAQDTTPFRRRAVTVWNSVCKLPQAIANTLLSIAKFTITVVKDVISYISNCFCTAKPEGAGSKQKADNSPPQGSGGQLNEESGAAENSQAKLQNNSNKSLVTNPSDSDENKQSQTDSLDKPIYIDDHPNFFFSPLFYYRSNNPEHQAGAIINSALQSLNKKENAQCIVIPFPTSFAEAKRIMEKQNNRQWPVGGFAQNSLLHHIESKLQNEKYQELQGNMLIAPIAATENTSEQEFDECINYLKKLGTDSRALLLVMQPMGVNYTNPDELMTFKGLDEKAYQLMESRGHNLKLTQTISNMAFKE